VFVPLPLALQPAQLLSAYAQGIFPMSPHRQSRRINWYRPEYRGVLPIAGFHVGRNLRRLLNRLSYEIRIDGDFVGTMRACAQRPQTWISDVLIEAYGELHRLGYAHSVEVVENGEVTGGLYGVALGGAFFGESMFQRQPDRAKVALAHCARRLAERGYVLWDTQYYTPHLGTFGGQEIGRLDYERQLEAALQVSTWFGATPPQPLS
jgi:leucyl/phenylalanyl-tRNA--protein transferase